MNQPVDVLGVKLDALTAPELLVELRQGIERGERQQVVTVTTEMIVRAQRDPKYRKLINQATWRIPDTIGAVWGAHFLEKPIRGPGKRLRLYVRALRTGLGAFIRPRSVKKVLPDTIPGSDLAVDLAGMCEEFGFNLYLLGGARGVAERAGQELRRRFPELKTVGADPSDHPPQYDRETVERIKSARANVLLVAYGAPEQEQWIARNLKKLPKGIVAMGSEERWITWAGEFR